MVEYVKLNRLEMDELSVACATSGCTNKRAKQHSFCYSCLGYVDTKLSKNVAKAKKMLDNKGMAKSY